MWTLPSASWVGKRRDWAAVCKYSERLAADTCSLKHGKVREMAIVSPAQSSFESPGSEQTQVPEPTYRNSSVLPWSLASTTPSVVVGRVPCQRQLTSEAKAGTRRVVNRPGAAWGKGQG